MRILWLGLILFCITWSASAQVAAPAPTAAPKPPAKTLQTALATAALPDAGHVAFAVGANRVKLPKGTDMPAEGADVVKIAPVFGLITRDFGGVTAVAPATMVLLNTAPANPNIYAGMPAEDAWTLLAASLSDAQWKALASDAGLGVADLQTDAQRQLFTALLPQGKLTVTPWYWRNIMYTDADVRDLSGQIPQAHLRLGQTLQAQITFKGKNGDEAFEMDQVAPASGAAVPLKLTDRKDYGGSQSTLYGVPVRALVPNQPKPGQLDLSARVLQAPVPLTGLKTVGDLVARIGAAAHLELYADKRLEVKSLTALIGPPAPLTPKTGAVASAAPDPKASVSAFPAADLLRALAFCVTGTWRQVGPAFVLTDDVVGIGTRCQLWYEFEQEADALRSGPVQAAGESLLQNHSPADLSWFGDPAALTPDQLKTDNHLLNADAKIAPIIERPLSTLTPGQQALAQRAAAEFANEYQHQYKEDELTPPGPQSQVMLIPATQLQLLLPGEPAPIDMNVTLGQSSLFRSPPVSPDERQKQQQSEGLNGETPQQYLKEHPEIMEKMRQENPKLLAQILAAPPPGPPPSLRELLAAVPRRAVLLRAGTGAEAAQDVATAQALGFNKLWLVVLEKGAASVSGSSLAPAAPPVGGVDILDAALQAAHGKEIQICPVLDLLTWGTSPPSGARDLNILGETSAQALARRQARKSMLPSNEGMMDEAVEPPRDPESVAVNPLSPEVGPVLRTLVADVASRPGISGLVWRDTAPPGYGPTRPSDITSSLLLGYNEPLRLAFLRLAHVDPIDITSPNYYTGKADVSLPMMDSDFSQIQILNSVVPQWSVFRHEQNQKFMQTLYAAANPAPAAKPLPIYVKQRGAQANYFSNTPFPGWYGSWDDPKLPPPTFHSPGDGDTPFQESGQSSPEDASAQAHAQSKIVFTPLILADLTRFKKDTRAAQDSLHVQGIVVDLTGNDIPPATDPLTALTALLKETPKGAAGK